MALIGYDVTLLIAEHLDMDSMVSLMATCRTNYQLIRGHERSLVNAKIAKLAHDPMLRPPLGALLSSSAPRQPGLDREVLNPLSFAVARELESREGRINTLFSPRQPLMYAIRRLPLFQHLPPDQMDRLIVGLKDACRVADRIADCAASVRLQQQQPKIGHLRDRERVIEYDIHLARQQYISSLPPIRLAFLTLLTGLVGIIYAQQQYQFPPGSDPFQEERIMAFKETFLRHGTVVISALLCPSGPDQNEPTEYYASQVDAVLTELLEYEGVHGVSSRPVEGDSDDSKPVQDGLHMTMLQAFQVPEESGDMAQSREDVDDEDEADGDWLFRIDVWDYGTDAVTENPTPLMSTRPDPREVLILEWIKQR